MRFIQTFFVFLLLSGQIIAQSQKLQFTTNYGIFKVVLYDFTPNHKQMFMEAIKNKVYVNKQFNRIIKNFVVQGGVTDQEVEVREQNIPEYNRPRLAPEFNRKAFHKIGALGAGRDSNARKGSFYDQIYFVVGKTVSKEELHLVEDKKGIKFTRKQRKCYLKYGGLPRLDHDYTIFGEVYEGLDVLIKISALPTNINDLPIIGVSFDITEIDH